MLYNLTLITVYVTLTLAGGYVLYQAIKAIAIEVWCHAQIRKRQQFYSYFRFLPPDGSPSREHTARVLGRLRRLAHETHQHHRAWVNDCEVGSPESINWLHEQQFHLAEKTFMQALQLAQKFQYVKHYYSSYLHYLENDSVLQSTKLLDLSIDPLHSLN